MWAWGYVYYSYTMVLAAIVLMGCVLSASLLYGQQERLAAVANQTRLVPIVNKVTVLMTSIPSIVPGVVAFGTVLSRQAGLFSVSRICLVQHMSRAASWW